MVTQPVPQRFPYFQRSLNSYCLQTHRRRELVIVLDQGQPDSKSAIAAHVASLARNDIQIVAPEGKLSLGALRNLSLDSVRGQIRCQWDDDDLNHPRRLEMQLQALVESGHQAAYLQEVMHYFSTSRTLYWTNWHATKTKSHPGTLMCWSSAPIRYPETGPSSQLGEDTAVAEQLDRQRGYHVLAGAPHLYVYVNHGDNSYGDDHHRMLATKLGISRGLLLRRERQLREGMRSFDFGPGDVEVQGYNGPAFILGREGGN